MLLLQHLLCWNKKFSSRQKPAKRRAKPWPNSPSASALSAGNLYHTIYWGFSNCSKSNNKHLNLFSLRYFSVCLWSLVRGAALPTLYEVDNGSDVAKPVMIPVASTAIPLHDLPGLVINSIFLRARYGNKVQDLPSIGRLQNNDYIWPPRPVWTLLISK